MTYNHPMRSDTLFANYFIAYVTTLMFFGVGAITTLGISWYQTLILPAWMPPTLLVAIVWALLFLLTAFSSSIVWSREPHDSRVRRAIALYSLNALLVLLWNYLFFGLHLLMIAGVVALAVGLSVVALMIQVARISKKATWLLAPYLAWMGLALYLNHVIWALNPY